MPPKSEYINRHNTLANYIHWNICRAFNFKDGRCIMLIVLSIECQQKPNNGLGDKITCSHELPSVPHKGRVSNPKNQLSQINSPTTVGCSLEYPIAKITMKLEAQFLSSQNYALLLWTRRTIYF